MRVKGYEVDRLFQQSCGYDNITDMMKVLREKLIYRQYNGDLHRGSLNLYISQKQEFIKENNITVLKYKGDDVWGGFIYDNLLELSDFLDVNYIERLEDLKTDLPKILLTKIREMKIVQKINGRYKWTGSRNYQALTNLILKYYVSPTDKAKELIKQHKENAYREACLLAKKSKDENDIYYYESVKYELEEL